MPLERIPPPAPTPPAIGSIRLGYLRLTLDDVQDVADYLRREGYAPVISAGQTAIATDAESLKGATGSELARVVVGVEEKSLGVYLYGGEAKIEYANGDDRARAASERVAAILRERQVPGLYVWMRILGRQIAVFGTLLVVLVGGSLAFSPYAWGRIEAGPTALVALALLVFCMILTWINYSDERKRGGVRLQPFFRRERRQVTLTAGQAIWTGVITAVASGAVGALVTWLLTGGGAADAP
ncbi:hypothetical protein GCM10027058_27740 [Microbacterium neimengense]